MTERAGIFITLEGGEGAGKSTAVRELAAMMWAEGREVVATREPGGSPGAEAIRALLLNTDVHVDPLAQTLLHFAARADHVGMVIRPALERGAVVICDRFYDSTMAYQVCGQGVNAAVVTSLIGLINLRPDITFMLEVPEELSKSRIARRGGTSDRYELMGSDVMARIARGFRAIAAAEPERCVMIDGARPVQAVVDEMRAKIHERTGW